MLRLASLLGLAAVSALLAGGCCHPEVSTHRASTALDRYVARPDPAYSWQLVDQQIVEGVRISFVDLTSQSWLTTNEVNRTLWQHWLVIYTPEQVDHSTALLFISGGSNRDGRLPKPSAELAQAAKATQAVAAELRMVPNQPLIFGNDGKERVEDDLIAYTWDKFLRTGDDRWPARLPMTKAAVRAMDTVTDFAATPKGGSLKVDRFIVAGGSKRGWTTWTTAIVDPRVVAICPIVIDMLNLVPSFIHHYRTYGFYAPAVQDYVNQGIMDWMDTPEFERLMKIVEPYEYRDRLSLPKLMVNACGDQFFLPDSARFYRDDLPGPKYWRYVPNADHSLKDSDAWETLVAWDHAILNRTPLPRFTWLQGDDGAVDLHVTDVPKEVRLWQATNPDARDFRLETLGPVWTSTVLEPAAAGHYRAGPAAPAKGWTAFMLELTYDLGAPVPLKVTTQVWVTPDTLPFAAPKPKTRQELTGHAQ
ncbi:MAG: hypothetical protein H7A45_21170 [Verrucomicrobiales bacterium]|nr:hypothetical protein [Verrucomicrobiales bacterium]MCP5525700.1 hypothetical protein [Verrucomicrobiales bacterium]